VSHFFGESRKLILNHLVNQFHEIESGSTTRPVIYVLEGSSGVGKSHIIREFYELLRARQFDGFNPYWPALGKPEHRSRALGVGDPLANRKVLGPSSAEFIWDANSLPTFLWLTISCVKGEHLQFDVVREQIERALEVHGDPMFLAARNRGGSGLIDIELLRRKLRVIEATDVISFSRDIALEVAGAVTNVIPGTGVAVEGLQKSIELYMSSRKRRKSLREQVKLGVTASSREAKLSELVHHIRDLTRVGLPAVIAIEDLHWMDQDLPYLLKSIAKLDAEHPIMVIATAWPESRSAETNSYSKWISAAAESGTAEVIEVPDLEVDALIEIVDTYAPATNPELKKAIITGWSNPYCLELFLSWDSISQCIEGESGQEYFDIDVEDLKRRPTEIRDLYAARWNDIVYEVRKALIATAGTLPQSNAMHPFEIEVVASVLAASDHLCDWANLSGTGVINHEEVVTECLKIARHISWTVINGAGESFREPGLADVVMEHMSNESVKTQRELRLGVIRELENRILLMGEPGLILNAQDPEHVLAASWLLEVAPLEKGNAFTSARFLRARQLAASIMLPQALEVLPESLFMDPLEQGGEFLDSFFTMRIEHDSWIADTGNTELALKLSKATTASATHTLGHTHLVTLASQVVLANRLGAVGEKDQAVGIFEYLESEISTRTDIPDDFAAVVKSGVALWTGDKDKSLAGSAAIMLESIIAEFTLKLGERSYQVMEARRVQARFVGESNDTNQAVVLYRRIVEDSREWFGSISPHSFEARRGFGRWLLANGQIAESLETCLSVEQDCMDMYGPENYLTLYATLGLVKAQAAAGQCANARLTFDRLKIAINVYDTVHRLHKYLAEALEELNRCEEGTESLLFYT